jgi:3',5'-cyclic-AMP phosphodiesterase
MDKKTFFLLICLTLMTACKYKLSAYSANAPDQDLNEINLSKISSLESSESDTFKIALISDTHNYYDELTKVVRVINEKGPYRFVIVSGDITNLGLLEEYELARNLLNKLNYPYLVAIGNHDHLANGEEIFSRIFGEKNFSFSYKGYLFVFIDNNNWENGRDFTDFAWIESELSTPVAFGKIIIAHVPPNDTKRFNQTEIQEWENVINSNGVNYFINGHNHNPAEGSFGNASQITVGAPSKGSYYELIISPAGVQHQKIDF